jgi:hypothetical protein
MRSGWRVRAVFLTALSLALGASAVPAGAAPPLPELGGITPLGADVQRLHFKYGPIPIAPGQNLILVGPVTIEQPRFNGYVIRLKPDLVRSDGSVPPVDVVHLHHGVWLNQSRRDSTAPTDGFGERFFAAGEEKTIFKLPDPYGYPVKPTDVWLLNYMLHNQTPVPEVVWITYDVDVIPANSRHGRRMIPARPIWMDVRNPSAYPVFDVKRGSGSVGRFTYPNQAVRPYGNGDRRNEWVVDRPGTLVAGAGHLHPGGLWDDLKVVRGNSSRLAFRSRAKYWDPAGPVSWDMAMTATDPSWRVGLRKGDRLQLSSAYESRRASWYESMGIFVGYMADVAGPDPFSSPIDTEGRVTHGHLHENDNHGGEPTGGTDPRTLPDGPSLGGHVAIAGFNFLPGNLGLGGPLGSPPTVDRGKSLEFNSPDAAAQIFHTITSCRAPCTASTGISYPLANGPVEFDSGELGYGPPGLTAASNRGKWFSPKNLAAGTYSYFCRIHPYMRGSFRVK